MTMLKVSLRIPNGWTQPVPNLSATHCDIDGARLYIAPHGGIYCDKVHK